MTSAADLGEAGLLARMLAHRHRAPGEELGPGDDAAVVRLSSARLVVTTDSLVEGHDFLREATTARSVGRKAAVQNIADVAAMGAVPQALVVAVSALREEPAETFVQISAGIEERAAREGVGVVGGDLGRAEQLAVTVTALGSLPEGQQPVTRAGALEGDVLAVGAPALGRSAAGLALALGGHARSRFAGDAPPRTTKGEQADAMLAWHDAPDPRLSLGWTSGAAAHAMMDLSDGLVRDGGRLAAASGVRLDLDSAALRGDVDALAPLARELDADPWDWVLHGGEEHCLLACFPPAAVPTGFRPIGRVLPGEAGLTLDGEPVRGEGFDHFR